MVGPHSDGAWEIEFMQGRIQMFSPGRCVSVAVATISALLMAGGSARADWPSDPGLNLPLATTPGSQVQPKIVARPDGGAYVSWFDGGAGGFDVRLQRISPIGEPMWGDNGVLVADRSFSSTQDYGLSTDSDGNALLVFRDDRFGGVLITANRVAPDGALLWGVNGVHLSSKSAFVAAPKIAGGSDGSVFVAWTNDSEARISRLDSAGEILWTDSLIDSAGQSFSPSDLRASDAPGQSGEVILLFVRQGNFATPRHLYAQKYSAAGTRLWGADPVVIFNSGSLQFGNFPTFVPDGVGGAAFAWYQSSPALQAYVQRLTSDGAAELQAGGLPVSTNAMQLHVTPSVAYDAATSSLYAFWVELNSFQSQFGVFGQKVAQGVRQWGDSGVVVVPLGAQEMTQVRALVLDGDPLVTFARTIGFGNQTIHSARRDGAGAPVWTRDLSTVASGVSRLDATVAGGAALFAWSDARQDDGDIYAQNLQSDGSLGVANVLGDLNGDGVVNGADLASLLANWGACSQSGACPADLDGNAVVNGADLASLLANWG